MVANLQLFKLHFVCYNTATTVGALYLLLDHILNITFEVATPHSCYYCC